MSKNSVLHSGLRQDRQGTKVGYHHHTLIADSKAGQGIRAEKSGIKIFSIYAHRLIGLGGWPWD